MLPLVYISSCRWRHFTLTFYVGHYFRYTSAGFSHSILRFELKQLISLYSDTRKRMALQVRLMKFVVVQKNAVTQLVNTICSNLYPCTYRHLEWYFA